jgi:hypothetical protein
MNLEEINKKASKLSLEEINNLSEAEVLDMVMERPGHPGQFGFMLQLPFFKSKDHLAETMYALMKRLEKIDNLEEKMQKKKEKLSLDSKEIQETLIKSIANS